MKYRCSARYFPAKTTNNSPIFLHGELYLYTSWITSGTSSTAKGTRPGVNGVGEGKRILTFHEHRRTIELNDNAGGATQHVASGH